MDLSLEVYFYLYTFLMFELTKVYMKGNEDWGFLWFGLFLFISLFILV